MFLDYLKIGDLVTFRSVLHSAFLHAEGILVEDLNVTNDLKLFDSALFSIHLQRKYSASRELNNFLTTNNIDMANIEDSPHIYKYLKALEVLLNPSLVKNSII